MVLHHADNVVERRHALLLAGVGQRGPVAGAPGHGDHNAGQRGQAVERPGLGHRAVGRGDHDHAARVRERLGGEG